MSDMEALKGMLDQHEQNVAARLDASIEEIKGTKAELEKSFDEKLDKPIKDLAARLEKSEAETQAVLERVKAHRAAAIMETSEEKAHQLYEAIGRSMHAAYKASPSLVEKADLQEDTATEGGYLIPTEQAREILRVAKDGGWALSQCRTVPMISKTLTFPVENAGVSSTIIAEEGNIETGAESSPTFTQATVTAKKFCQWTAVSEELEEDEFIGLGGYLATIMGEAYARQVDNQVASGDGTGVNFTGILSAGSVNELGTVGTLAWDDLVDLEAEITPIAQQGARFVLNQVNLARIKKLKDSSNMPIWQPPVGGAPATILGYPYSVDTQMANTAIIFGDLRRVVIGQRRGISIGRSMHYYFNTAQVALRAIARTGIVVGTPTGLAKATGITG